MTSTTVKDAESNFKYTLKQLATLTPSCPGRAWLSAPHPCLPIIATASSDKSVRVYSLTSHRLLSTISGGHKRSVRTCAWQPFSKEDCVLATGSFDASVGIWRKETHQPPGSGEEDFTGLSGNSRTHTHGQDDGSEDWNFAVILDGHDSEVKSVAWNAGGNFLATCSRDKSVWIWEETEDDNFETIAVLQEHEGDVKCVTWHPEEDLLASASYDDTIRLYKEDVDDWTCVCVLEGHSATVWSVDFEKRRDKSLSYEAYPVTGQDPNNLRLISCSDDLTIRTWRRRSGGVQVQGTQKERIPSSIRTDTYLEQWDEDGVLPRKHSRTIYAVSWCGTSGRVVSAGGDGRIVVYEEGPASHEQNQVDARASTEGIELHHKSNWSVVAEVEGAHDVYEINHVCWAKGTDGKEVVISTGDDGEVKVWSLEPRIDT